jgi:hypothetical protein
VSKPFASKPFSDGIYNNTGSLYLISSFHDTNTCRISSITKQPPYDATTSKKRKCNFQEKVYISYTVEEMAL